MARDDATKPDGSSQKSAPKIAIVLARHGRPALDRSRTMSWRDYVAWWDAYEDGGLADDQEPPDRKSVV